MYIHVIFHRPSRLCLTVYVYIHMYEYIVYICIYTYTKQLVKLEAMNLVKSGEWYMARFGGKKGKGEVLELY